MLKRRADGGFDLNLDDDRREVLTVLLRDLEARIDAAPDDPDLVRLSPPAYLDDPDADAAYQLLAGEELRASHRASIESVIESLGRKRLTEAEAWAWIQSLNAVRLVAGTRLDISEDDHGPFGRPTPKTPEERSLWAVYDFTTYLQHEVVEALGS